jgi:hypothetical protein
MENHPFSQSSKAQDTGIARRRSTRIDFVTTVLLSGKDATGTPFREYTQTATVNLHGCKVRTSYKIVVGMLVNLECPKAGTSGKGVCIRVWEPSPGVAGHEIAIQLIKPQNLWGVSNPPADWEIVAKSMVQGRAQAEPTVVTNVAAATIPAPRPAIPPPPVAVAPPRPAPPAGPTADQRLAELERRATKLVESVLDILRSQAEELTRNSLEEFRQQVDALIQDSEMRMRQGLMQAYEETTTSLISLRTDIMEQITARGAQILGTTEDALRARIANPGVTEEKSVTRK